jgi:predicted dehydrogenase
MTRSSPPAVSQTNSHRRRFLTQSVAASTTAVAFAGFHINPSPAKASTSPNEKLNLVAVGATGRAGANIEGCKSQNIIAIADVDAELLEKGAANYPSARRYEDFRIMLEKESEKIDGVLVGTPDHTHAPAAAMALRMKKHVYCEKPLTHTVRETRTLRELAKAAGVATQMGTQIHAGANYRRVVELVKSGAVGPIQEVHVWANAKYTGGKFETGNPIPKNLNWDLWLGPAPERPYSKSIHPFHWRNFWDFGTGALGDFGCHYMDLVHWALDLTAPNRIAARGPDVDLVSPPAWAIVDYHYPARGDMPPVHLTWYDSGKVPDRLSELKDKDGKPIDWKAGQLFVGRDGMILSNYGQHLLLPVDRFANFQKPQPTIPDSIGHHEEWLAAIRNGTPTTCSFEYSGALSEAVLLGVVAYKSGQEIQWDSANFKVTNSEKAQSLLHKEYRKGWTL